MIPLHRCAVAGLAMAALLTGGCNSSASDLPQNDAAANQPPLVAIAATPTVAVETAKVSFQALTPPAQAPTPAVVVKLPTLMYHHVGDPPADADQLRRNLTVSGGDFEQQMHYLKTAGYQPVSQRQLFQTLFAGEALPPQAVLLTFDDGYLDNYQMAVPILKKYGFVATFNIITDYVGTPEYMSWDQVSELDRNGMEIGSHTCDHPDLATLALKDLKHQLDDSAAALAAHLGHPVYWLCYPAGKYDADVIAVAKEAGYLLAVTTKPGEKQSSDAPYELLRYRVRNDTSLESFQELVK